MRKLKFLSMLMFVAMTSFMFVACSNDDDNDKSEDDNIDSSALIGSWKSDFDGGYYVVTFKSNNTGTLVEYSDDSVVEENENFRYSYNSSSQLLRITYTGGEVDEYTVLSATSNTLKVRSLEDNSVLTFTKYTGDGDDDQKPDDPNPDDPNPDVTAEALVGTWRAEYQGGDYEDATLNSDGRGTWLEYRHDLNRTETEDFYWTFDEKTKKLTLIFVSDESYKEEWYTVVGIYDERVVLKDEDGETEIWKKQSNVDPKPDNPKPDASVAALIGTWGNEDSKGYYEVTLNKDGRGVWREYKSSDDRTEVSEPGPFYWTYEEKTKKLTLTFVSDDDYEEEAYTVVGIYDERVVLKDKWGETEIWKKV